MSSSTYVCARDGIPVHGSRDGWRHALGGRTGAIPRHRRHYPVPVLRADYDRAFAIDTPVEEAREMLREFRELDEYWQGWPRRKRKAGIA